MVSSFKGGERPKLLLRLVSEILPLLTFNTSVNEWIRFYVARLLFLLFEKVKSKIKWKHARARVLEVKQSINRSYLDSLLS